MLACPPVYGCRVGQVGSGGLLLASRAGETLGHQIGILASGVSFWRLLLARRYDSAGGRSHSIQVASIRVAHPLWLTSSWLLQVFFVAHFLHVHICPSAYIYICNWFHIRKERKIQTSAYVESATSCSAKMYLGSVLQYALIQDSFWQFPVILVMRRC